MFIHKKSKRLKQYKLNKPYLEFKNANLGFSKICSLRPKWCINQGYFMICVCTNNQDVILFVSANNWDITC